MIIHENFNFPFKDSLITVSSNHHKLSRQIEHKHKTINEMGEADPNLSTASTTFNEMETC